MVTYADTGGVEKVIFPELWLQVSVIIDRGINGQCQISNLVSVIIISVGSVALMHGYLNEEVLNVCLPRLRCSETLGTNESERGLFLPVPES